MTTQEQPTELILTGDGSGTAVPELQPGQPLTVQIGEFSDEPFEMAPEIRFEDISWRVDSKPTQDQRARFISYIDARTAAKYLDEWVGPDGWEERYEEATLRGIPVLWCHLTIHFPRRSITRSDLATFSEGRGGDAETKTAVGIKGWTSGAFKRAATKYGIGRIAYELPEVWAPVRVDDRNRAWPNKQTMPAIVAECRKAGYDVGDSVRVDDKTTDDAPAPTHHNWFRETKFRIFENVDGDKAVAADVFTRAMKQLGLDSIDDEATSDAVTAAATTLHLANGIGKKPEEPKSAPVDHSPPAPVDDSDGDSGAWLHEYGNKRSAEFELAARRAVYSHTRGDLGSAKAIFEALTETMEHPLTQDDYYVLKAALNDPGPAA
jgi:hypothetical protein